MSRVTLGLATLRAVGIGAVLLLFVNPALGHWGAARHDPPLVLLDASLSMAGAGGRWRTALDTARIVGRGGVIWRFGDAVTAFDTTAPSAGASRVGPALAAAAARGGPVVIVTDGAITDLQDAPADLRRRARVIVLARPPFRDAFVAAADAPRRVSMGDTVRIKVAYGTAGPRGAPQRGQLVVEAAGRRLAAIPAVLPDSGLVTTDVLFPASRLASPGFHVLTVRLDGVADAEPRDDARQLVLDLSAQPSAVVLAAPPDWEARFLTRALEDVARVPVRLYDQTEVGHWREGRTLATVDLSTVTHDVQAAHLVVLVGNPQRLAPFQPRTGGGTAALLWNTAAAAPGDWYVQMSPASPLEGDLAGIPWDSLPPVSAMGGGGAEADGRPADSGTTAVLSARLGRRGQTVPIVSLQERGGGRRVLVSATGLWRWAFRGGLAEQAYRGMVAAIANWLLEQGAGTRDRAVPVRREVPNGTPLVWHWVGKGAPASEGVRVMLTNEHGIAYVDTLRFDALSQALVRVPPGEYRYEIGDDGRGRGDQGLVVVETYSDEWRPTPPSLTSQPGSIGEESSVARWRERWWLFVLAIAAFTGEWVWRRRQGLP